MEVHKCEYCGNMHNGNYGSGRFCSKSCACKFSIKNKKSEDVLVICEYCKKSFTIKKYKQKYNVKFCSKTCSNKGQRRYGWKSAHEKIKDNPEWWSNLQKDLYTKGIQKIGGGKTKWYEYKDIKVQGTYELRTCKILDHWKSVNKIKDWEYTNDRIQYIGIDNKQHSYLIDFKVFNLDGTFYYLEVKGFEHPNDKLKWESVKSAGFELKVWFGVDIEINENGPVV